MNNGIDSRNPAAFQTKPAFRSVLTSRSYIFSYDLWNHASESFIITSILSLLLFLFIFILFIWDLRIWFFNLLVFGWINNRSIMIGICFLYIRLGMQVILLNLNSAIKIFNWVSHFYLNSFYIFINILYILIDFIVHRIMLTTHVVLHVKHNCLLHHLFAIVFSFAVI